MLIFIQTIFRDVNDRINQHHTGPLPATNWLLPTIFQWFDHQPEELEPRLSRNTRQALRQLLMRGTEECGLPIPKGERRPWQLTLIELVGSHGH